MTALLTTRSRFPNYLKHTWVWENNIWVDSRLWCTDLCNMILNNELFINLQITFNRELQNFPCHRILFVILLQYYFELIYKSQNISLVSIFAALSPCISQLSAPVLSRREISVDICCKMSVLQILPANPSSIFSMNKEKIYSSHFLTSEL